MSWYSEIAFNILTDNKKLSENDKTVIKEQIGVYLSDIEATLEFTQLPFTLASSMLVYLTRTCESYQTTIDPHTYTRYTLLPSLIFALKYSYDYEDGAAFVLRNYFPEEEPAELRDIEHFIAKYIDYNFHISDKDVLSTLALHANETLIKQLLQDYGDFDQKTVLTVFEEIFAPSRLADFKLVLQNQQKMFHSDIEPLLNSQFNNVISVDLSGNLASTLETQATLAILEKHFSIPVVDEIEKQARILALLKDIKTESPTSNKDLANIVNKHISSNFYQQIIFPCLLQMRKNKKLDKYGNNLQLPLENGKYLTPEQTEKLIAVLDKYKNSINSNIQKISSQNNDPENFFNLIRFIDENDANYLRNIFHIPMSDLITNDLINLNNLSKVKIAKIVDKYSNNQPLFNATDRFPINKSELTELINEIFQNELKVYILHHLEAKKPASTNPFLARKMIDMAIKFDESRQEFLVDHIKEEFSLRLVQYPASVDKAIQKTLKSVTNIYELNALYELAKPYKDSLSVAILANSLWEPAQENWTKILSKFKMKVLELADQEEAINADEANHYLAILNESMGNAADATLLETFHEIITSKNNNQYQL